VGAGEDHGVHRRPLLHLVRLARQAALVNLDEKTLTHSSCARPERGGGDLWILLNCLDL
jgi:hypothetical protein